MKYSGKQDKYNAEKFLTHLIDTNSDFEIKKLNKNRSLSQNRYLHLLINFFSMEFGFENEYTKQYIFKSEVNYEIFHVNIANKKTGEYQEFYRSSADLDTKEMTIAIERFKNYSAKIGLVLPEANDYEYLKYIENNIEKYAEYL